MKLTIFFLIINFTTLGVGGYLMGEGPSSEWYQSINKAPWTPPGWMFGFAWTTIMICFSIFMSYSYQLFENKTSLLALFIIQLILNVSWNPVFFYLHNSELGLIIIGLLTLSIAAFFSLTIPVIKQKALLILPYLFWLIIATSLNGYIYLKN